MFTWSVGLLILRAYICLAKQLIARAKASVLGDHELILAEADLWAAPRLNLDYKWLLRPGLESSLNAGLLTVVPVRRGPLVRTPAIVSAKA